MRFVPGFAAASIAALAAPGTVAAVDVCREPQVQASVAVGTWRYGRSPLRGTPASTRVEGYAADVALRPGEAWGVRGGYRGHFLNARGIELQTNGYLHTFFAAAERGRPARDSGLRLSVAPALSASSNVAKDPGEYRSDAFQLLFAALWQRRLSASARVRYGACADHRFGTFSVYPSLALDWQPHPDWRVMAGFPDAEVAWEAGEWLTARLSLGPDGNEWHVRDRSLENGSQLEYRAWALDLSLEWRLGQRLVLSTLAGRVFDARYEATLADGNRLSAEAPATTRIGFGIRMLY